MVLLWYCFGTAGTVGGIGVHSSVSGALLPAPEALSLCLCPMSSVSTAGGCLSEGSPATAAPPSIIPAFPLSSLPTDLYALAKAKTSAHSIDVSRDGTKFVTFSADRWVGNCWGPWAVEQGDSQCWAWAVK